jgi:hypothetical protein
VLIRNAFSLEQQQIICTWVRVLILKSRAFSFKVPQKKTPFVHLEIDSLMSNLSLQVTRYGNGEIDGVGSFWVSKDHVEITRENGYADPIPAHSDPNSGILNLRTKARMNIPYGKSTFPELGVS